MIGLLLQFLSPIIDRVIPDTASNDKAKKEIEKMVASGELSAIQKQIEANIQQSKHSSIFVAGARPFIMWVCGVAFLWHFLLQPITIVILSSIGVEAHYPEFDISSLMTVLMGMLGLGGMRTYEKFKKVSRESL